MARHSVADQRSSSASVVLALHAALDPFVLAQSQHHQELCLAFTAEKDVHETSRVEAERTAQ